MKHLTGDIYGDNEVIEYNNTRIPRWLWIFYIGTPIWAVIWFSLYWNGMGGVLDEGHWLLLERAADTTFPTEVYEGPDPAEDTPYIKPLPGV